MTGRIALTINELDRVRSMSRILNRVKWYHEDDWVTLASLDADLTVDDLIEEFGLTPLAAYRERASRAIESARK